MDRVKRFLPLIVLAGVIALIFGMGWNRYLSLDTIRDHGQTFRALATAADLYSAIDLASDKIDTQLKKHRERTKSRHKPKASDTMAEAVPPVENDFSVVRQPVVPVLEHQRSVRQDVTSGVRANVEVEAAEGKGKRARGALRIGGVDVTRIARDEGELTHFQSVPTSATDVGTELSC